MSASSSENNLAAAFLKLIATSDLPALGPEQRPSAKPAPDINAIVRAWANEHHLDADKLDVLRSAALLWHDHLDASHSISQSIPTATGSFLHGIMHRREPDYGNAKYWFHRVHSHPAYSDITESVRDRIDSGELPSVFNFLVQNGNWDPFGFVDAVDEEFCSRKNPEVFQGLQVVQQVEFECLVTTVLS